MAKPITTIEVISTILGMVKTGLVALTLIMLEYSKIEKSKAKLGEALAKNDLEIEKIKNAKNDTSDADVIADFLKGGVLQPSGDGSNSSSDKKS